MLQTSMQASSYDAHIRPLTLYKRQTITHPSDYYSSIGLQARDGFTSSRPLHKNHKSMQASDNMQASDSMNTSETTQFFVVCVCVGGRVGLTLKDIYKHEGPAIMTHCLNEVQVLKRLPSCPNLGRTKLQTPGSFSKTSSV